MIRLILVVLVVGVAQSSWAQTEVEKRLPVSGHDRLDLELPFADEISLKTWNNTEVLVKATVSINDGEDDDLFELEITDSQSTIYVEANKDFNKRSGKDRNCWEMEIHYEVYFPRNMEVDAKTISGDYVMEFYGKPANIKTISGDVDLTVPSARGLDFRVKTISGEVYSDLDISYPNGTKGLRQMVGTNVDGEVNGGGEFLDLETISGDIFLRKG